jgi:hypothetical protein
MHTDRGGGAGQAAGLALRRDLGAERRERGGCLRDHDSQDQGKERYSSVSLPSLCLLLVLGMVLGIVLLLLLLLGIASLNGVNVEAAFVTMTAKIKVLWCWCWCCWLLVVGAVY